ncbi:MAG: HAMP domain-containing histidine kinase [Chloroflexi bacterium]|nr:HAMP domain-containing histidine kinase [Chloroflexota bacterium]
MRPQVRPPWWPEGQAYPPQAAEWQRMRGRFFRRFAIFFVLVFFVVVAGVIALFLAVASALSGDVPRIHPLAFVVTLFLFFMLFSFAARAVRRSLGRPLGDLIEATGRIEAGDYAVRLREHGPREVRRLARAFNAMSSRLDASESERRRLLADVTHELRTPLTVMQGNIEALIDGIHPADPEHLQRVLEETKVLSRLVDDLRTLSLAGADALALSREPVDVSALVRETLRSFAAQADAAGVTLEVTSEAGLPAVDGDPVRLREVLSNIVANALRYTPRGRSVSVSARRDGVAVGVSVRDTGPGIEADVRAHLFERFARSTTSPGAGLGLAIAKGIVTAHGGSIDAVSEPGRGTEVRFTIPVSRPDADAGG